MSRAVEMGVPINLCPFCGSRRTRFNDDALSVECRDCAATGPEGNDEREAVDMWNGVGKPSLVHLHETPHPKYPGAVAIELLYGNLMLCDVVYCSASLVPTLRGALMLMGGMHQAEESEGG